MQHLQKRYHDIESGYSQEFALLTAEHLAQLDSLTDSAELEERGARRKEDWYLMQSITPEVVDLLHAGVRPREVRPSEVADGVEEKRDSAGVFVPPGDTSRVVSDTADERDATVAFPSVSQDVAPIAIVSGLSVMDELRSELFSSKGATTNELDVPQPPVFQQPFIVDENDTEAVYAVAERFNSRVLQVAKWLKWSDQKVASRLAVLAP